MNTCIGPSTKPTTMKDDLDELPSLPAVGNMPLPSFLEVQWSSVRVCDPLLTYKQPTSPDLLLEGQGCIPQTTGERNILFSEDNVHTGNEMSSEMWQM